MGGHQSFPVMSAWRPVHVQELGAKKLWRLGQGFLPPLRPSFPFNFGHKSYNYRQLLRRAGV